MTTKKNPAGQAGSTARTPSKSLGILTQWRFFGNDPLEGGFVRVPRALLSDPRLRPAEKLTWIAVAAHFWGKRTKVSAAASQIARLVGCSSRTARAALARLEAKGYLELRRRPGRPPVVTSLRFRVNAENTEGNSNVRQPGKIFPGSPTTPEKISGGEEKFAGGGRQKFPGGAAKFSGEIKEEDEDSKEEEKCPAAVALAGQRPADLAAGHPGEDPVNDDSQVEGCIEAQAREVLDDLNLIAGTHWRPNSVNLEPIRRRLREGYDVCDLTGIVYHKSFEWDNTPMARHLKPASLFGDDKRFRQYLGESQHWADNLRATERIRRSKDRIANELGRLRQQYRAAKERGASGDELEEIERKGRQLKAQLQRLEAEQQELDREFEEFMEMYRQS